MKKKRTKAKVRTIHEANIIFDDVKDLTQLLKDENYLAYLPTRLGDNKLSSAFIKKGNRLVHTGIFIQPK